MVGFGRNAVLGVADKVIDAVKSGAIKHFFLVGGCDGARPGRNYYTEFVEKTPKDTVVLTLACGKYRFNKLELGDIGGIPRLLDVGQCNDAYSAVKIAVALADAFKTDVNSPAAVVRAVVVRAEGGRDTPDAPAPRAQEHPARADAAGVRDAERAQGPRGQLQHNADYDGGGGS